MVEFEKQGKENAIKSQNAIERKNFTKATFIEDGSKITVAYLYCGSRNCAGIDPETKGIVYFPQKGHRVKKSQ